MPEAGRRAAAAGVDAGTECVKAVVIDAAGQTLGRSIRPSRGYFEACAHEALDEALADAGIDHDALAGIGATGFGRDNVRLATHRAADGHCQARSAFLRFRHAMTLVCVGARDVEVVRIGADGAWLGSRGGRACGVGIGSFLGFAARHLDVADAQLDELAQANSGAPAPVSSYCSVFSSSGVLEQLRSGASREAIAQGCVLSITERIAEIGGFDAPVRVAGGVAEYFPGLLRALETMVGVPFTPLAEPIFAGAHGAALLAISG